jgi:hypothetical protein
MIGAAVLSRLVQAALRRLALASFAPYASPGIAGNQDTR